MNSEAKQFLFKLLDTPSPTGFESEGQKVWMNYVGRFADSLDNDSYGNAWATLAGDESSARIMLEAHADEIGFMIQNVTDDGFVYVTRIGGSDRAIARGKRVQILGEKGPVLGVIGNIAIHLRDRENDKIPEVHELYVDIGATSAAAPAPVAQTAPAQPAEKPQAVAMAASPPESAPATPGNVARVVATGKPATNPVASSGFATRYRSDNPAILNAIRQSLDRLYWQGV